MMIESWLFLGVILGIALIAKNQSLIIATVVVLILKLIPQTDKWMTLSNQKGLTGE